MQETIPCMAHALGDIARRMQGSSYQPSRDFRFRAFLSLSVAGVSHKPIFTFRS